MPDIKQVAQESAKPQAGIFDYTSNSTDGKHVTVNFTDNNPSYMNEIADERDPSRGDTMAPDMAISEFFKRPVKIHFQSWVVGTELDILLDPWHIWATNKRVSNRLSNFKLFSGNLRLKILVNGNQFYFGKALASYTPYNNNPFITYTANNMLDLVPASQRPHVWLDPCTSQGGELACPFFYPEDMLDITVANAFRTLGKLWLTTVGGSLEHAQSQTYPVTISVYAWMENIQLSAPTKVNISGISAQSGAVDEYADNPISKPASVLADMAGKLTDAPIIGRYAMATKMAAGAVGNIAKYFGYSRPNQLDATKPYRVWQTGNLASTDCPDTCMTLALQDKQEVTIDPTVAGLGSQDELDFSYLSSIESYLATFKWGVDNAPNIILFSSGVTPCQQSIGTYSIPASKTGVAQPPMGWIARPFKYWRGTITYRFQLASSAYHKGRLIVTWDPKLATFPAETNVVQTHIVDISEERDFSVTVGWGASTAGLLVSELDPTVPTYTLSNGFGTSIFIPTDTEHNGVLSVAVENRLVSSGANTEPIRCNVMVSSKDLTLWEPNGQIAEYTNYPDPVVPPAAMAEEPFVPNSGTLEADEPEQNAPEGADMIDTFGSPTLSNQTAGFTSGEKVTSFRQCLKRYCYERQEHKTASVTQDFYNQVQVQGDMYPIYRGYQSGGMQGTSTSVLTTIESYVLAAFAGWRGAKRFKFIPSYGLADHVKVLRGDVYRPRVFSTNASMLVRQLDWNDRETWTGTQITNKVSGNIIDFQLPYYSKLRFLDNWTSPSVNTPHGYAVNSEHFNFEASARFVAQVWDIYRSVGEDFNAFFFLGVPPTWRVDIFL